MEIEVVQCVGNWVNALSTIKEFSIDFTNDWHRRTPSLVRAANNSLGVIKKQVDKCASGHEPGSQSCLDGFCSYKLTWTAEKDKALYWSAWM